MAPASPSLEGITFPPFHLDRRAGLLRRGETPLALRPKTYAVLLHLAERPGELVTKQALLEAIWPGVAVTEDVVRQSVGELRTALGDERATPRFIATVPRRGYRFIAELAVDEARPPAPPAHADAAARETDGTVVGRARERATIAEWLRAVRNGRRQVAFIAGEAGIGKTTLVDTVIDELRRGADTTCRIARGQCIEHFGGGEPYLPVLEALAEICRGSDGAAARAE
ncbi:winged helix-turn-helix domain-containing protein, partial [Candidatus Binatia bacterium]|nr:winged helix-turn-helix domain-containing protein [Candidatus Binatia bacterium]